MLFFKRPLLGSYAALLAVISLLSFPAFSSAQNSGPSSAAATKTEQMQPLIQASAKRIAVAHEVAFAKWDTHTPVEDIERENQVIEAVVSQAKQQGLDEKFVTSFFRAQIEANKVVQYGLLADWYRAGKAPQHSTINLKETIRPQLDTLQTTLLDQLRATSTIREAADCHTAVAAAVGSYRKREGTQMGALDFIALDRSVSSFCAR